MFEEFDLNKLNNPEFKEDSVREEIIIPILQKLGYNSENIVRSKNLSHPFIKIGSKKRQITLIPDYLFKIENRYAWVLDAKSPKESIDNTQHIEQIFSYSIHPEVRTKYFALCNGIEFVLFRQDEQTPILKFYIKDIDDNWEKLEQLVSINSFQIGKKFEFDNYRKIKEFDYLVRPLIEEVPVKKQATKRHFGVHGYFTKQSWNVVQEYIRNFTKPGDLILDPFGGSGITAIEALMIDRKAISIDINPLAVFLVNALILPVEFDKMNYTLEEIKKKYEKLAPKTDNDIDEILKKYPFPKGILLPKGSDVDTIEKLFSNKQLAELSILKSLILKIKENNIKQSFLLMFSGLVTKINLTYHTSKFNDKNKGGGNAAPFMYYRYRIAPNPVELDLMQYFDLRFKKIMLAKKEIEYNINEKTITNVLVKKGTATKLDFIKKESVDYIYTDPPYGKKIPYLDLSIMWNAWLDFPVTEEDYDLEAIEGGKNNKTKLEYNFLISKSIEEMYRVLKFDRWLSFVFAHKDPEFWHLIIETAEKCGFEYAGAVKQSNGQSSFKKRQNPFTVLSGQLIINFKKVRKPRSIMKAALGMNIGEIIIQTCEGLIANKHGATLEDINDELIIKGLELGFLDLLKKEYSDLTPFLLDSFDYDEKKEIFTIKKNQKFKTSIDINLRIKYYLISFLRRKELENYYPTFDEIILNIIPLLKNGITPEKQTVLNVLETIAYQVGEENWKLKKDGQQSLFS